MYEYGVCLMFFDELLCVDVIVVVVLYCEYVVLIVEEIGKKLVKGGVFIDVKVVFDVKVLLGVGY